MSVFSYVGKIVVFYFLVSSIFTFYWRFFRTADWSQYEGEWAIVTGSSYGIGPEFALGLAKRGINVIVTARTQYKLEDLKKEINTKYPKVKVKILVIDVAQDGWEKSIEKETKDLNISILINNVGGNVGVKRIFHENSYDSFLELHKLNLFSMQRMVYDLLPKMVIQKKGRIINVSSLAIYFPYKLSVYPGDKSFINTFTEQLNTEYEPFGIRAESLLVGKVSTPALGNAKPDGLMTCTPTALAESALDLWGWHEVYIPFWGHALITWSLYIPKFILRPIERDTFDELSAEFENGIKIINKIHEKGKTDETNDRKVENVKNDL